MINRILVLVLLLATAFVNAQEVGEILEGRVFSTSNDVSAVHVSNLNANRGTITDVNGFFSITARLGDTLAFSAVQFKKKEVVVTQAILEAPLFLVPLEDMLTELNEVVVTPYNLSGELNRDMANLKVGEIMTASTLALPNAYVKPPTQSQRKLYTARTWDLEFYGLAITFKLDPLFNYFSGRTKMLKKRVARESTSERVEGIRKFYADSLYIRDLRLSKTQINDFIYFCEQDSLFKPMVAVDDKLKLWEFLKDKSEAYRKNNGKK